MANVIVRRRITKIYFQCAKVYWAMDYAQAIAFLDTVIQTGNISPERFGQTVGYAPHVENRAWNCDHIAKVNQWSQTRNFIQRNFEGVRNENRV